MGHTPMNMITKEGKLDFRDVFSTYQDGKPIGTEEFLLLDTETWECSGIQGVREIVVDLIDDRVR